MPEDSQNLIFPWKPFLLDMNSDGKTTITDVGLWLEQIFFIPGDWLIWALLSYARRVADFLEMSTADYGGSLAALLSVLAWFCVTCVLMITTHYLGALDRALTRLVVAVWQGAARRAKAVWSLVRVKFSDPPKAEQVLNLHGGENLSSEEMHVLRLHAETEPPALLDIDAVVQATQLPPDQICQILDKLRKLRFVDEQRAGSGNHACYSVTQPGKAFLVFRDLSAG